MPSNALCPASNSVSLVHERLWALHGGHLRRNATAELSGTVGGRTYSDRVSLTTAAPQIQNHGEVFTRRWVVDVLLDLTGYRAERNLSDLLLLEPSCGSGAFLGPAIERLLASATKRGRPVLSLRDSIRAYDLLPEHVANCRQLCRDVLRRAGASEENAALLAEAWVNQADFLIDSAIDGLSVDVAIGNPPYIRYDDLPEDVAAEYRRKWLTMRGRGDIYIGFFERALVSLKPGGRVGFICADRWMRNQYGAALRAVVSERFAVEHVWPMHDVDAFEAKVSAYPAITVLANHPQASVVVADTTADFGPNAAAALAAATRQADFEHFEVTGVTAHKLPHWFAGGSLWPTGSPARLALIEYLNDHFRPLHDPQTGTRVSIGVATGADQVYVTKDRDAVEPDRLLPLAMRRDLMTGTFKWQGNYLVNPWTDDGDLVRLTDYPRFAAYLESHPSLRKRHVARKAPASWHRTIDKVTPGLLHRPKLLIQDMKAHIHPVLEPGGHYPHHNLYYVVSDQWDMEVLGGLLLSRVAQAFIEAYCVRMRGGTLRFQAQYLKQIRVPSPASLSTDLQSRLRSAFVCRDVSAATEAAAAAYGIDLDSFELNTPGK